MLHESDILLLTTVNMRHKVAPAVVCVSSGFRREVDENCALLGHYAARNGNS
jgi:hypothetical protein